MNRSSRRAPPPPNSPPAPRSSSCRRACPSQLRGGERPSAEITEDTESTEGFQQLLSSVSSVSSALSFPVGLRRPEGRGDAEGGVEEPADYGEDEHAKSNHHDRVERAEEAGAENQRRRARRWMEGTEEDQQGAGQ